jgi:hypothetical protein
MRATRQGRQSRAHCCFRGPWEWDTCAQVWRGWDSDTPRHQRKCRDSR